MSLFVCDIVFFKYNLLPNLWRAAVIRVFLRGVDYSINGMQLKTSVNIEMKLTTNKQV